ncbi:hypothetical protein [Massilia timonae]|uniref:hypothetical protein n=1 Tax=Massilia timonae TaxID=47229 RepID=UPI0028966D84|nr:hypothetical protein [Massilia timonae]
MLSFLYSRSEHASEQQLREDFGEFPPAPLQCQSPAFTFVLVHVRGPGAWLNHWKRSDELLHALESASETVAPELRGSLTGLFKASPQTDIESGNTRVAYRPLVPRFLLRVLLMKMFQRFETERKGGLAYVLPITQHDRQITLLGRASRKTGQAVEILAHEHLHLLQQRSTVEGNKDPRDLHLILKEKWIKDREVVYLFDRHEVEARLHELVLSYYRARAALPVSLDEFYEMLADWEEIGTYLVHTLAEAGMQMEGTGNTFKPRSKLFGTQLGAVLSGLKDSEATKQFVSEVLPVMYGNLLCYYGDVSARVIPPQKERV